MMTPEQQELITLAAQVMGYEGVWSDGDEEDDTVGFEVRNYLNESTFEYRRWNPLTSPADSHAVMCALEIDIKFMPRKRVRASFCGGKYYPVYFWVEPYTTDKAAACRLAILRVAAEIGG